MRNYLLLAVLGFALLGCQPKDPYTYAMIETDFGNMKIKLYNSTPTHRDNFIKLANESYYDGLLFHRVMQGFMIQGGDPQSKNAPPGMRLGTGGPGYELDPEIGALHIKGALSAARTPNPQKRSSGSQFFIVHGSSVDEKMLLRNEQRSGYAYTDVQKQLYMELGGYPSLDYEYTVFGEVVEGMEVIDEIAAVPIESENRPLQDVTMKVRILN